MSEAKHTPGPWEFGGKFEDDPDLIIKSGDIHICVVSAFDDDEWSEEEKATARLIVAAPDLLEALESAYIALNYVQGPWQAVALAAISKAKGEINA